MDRYREYRLIRKDEANGEERRCHDGEENERTTKHESSFREGFECAASDRSSDSGLPSPPPSQVAKPSGVVAEKRLPLQRRDRPGLAPEVPYRSPGRSARLASSDLEAIALDLDVLADTLPLWRDWLEDVARRTHVELEVPDDRTEAATILD